MVLFIIIFTSAGLLLLIGGYSSILKAKKFQKEGIRALAKVIDIEVRKETDLDAGDMIFQYPIVEFINTKREKVQVTLNQGSGENFVGQNIPIIYLKKGADYDVITNMPLFTKRFPIGMIIAALVCLGIAILAYYSG